MGTLFENNDTLQLTAEQGFPAELQYEKHKDTPLRAEDFEGREFSFKDKKDLRNYHTPPTRVFLVENIDGKWLYWGTVHITSISHDYVNKKTSGTYKIEYIYTPEEMKTAYELMDRRPDKDYLGS